MATPQAFVTGVVVAAAITPVVAPPTTSPGGLCLYNGDPIKSYTLTSVSSSYTVTAAASQSTQIFAHMSVAPLKALPSGGSSSQGIKPLSGNINSGSLAQCRTNLTIVNDGIWHPVGPSINSGAATATVALGSWVNLTQPNGQPMYVIPPGGMITFTVVSSTAAGSVVLYCTWVEQ